MAAAESPDLERLALVPGVFAGVWGKRRDPTGTFGVLLERLSEVANMRLIKDLTGDLIRERIVYQDLAAVREATSAFLAALAQIRLVGSAGPPVEAENIAALVCELFASAPIGRFSTLTKHLPPPKHERKRQQAKLEHHQNCLRALGEAHRRFTLAAQEDLAHRGWHVRRKPRSHPWQFWRQPTLMWAGGSPGPHAKALIAEVVQSSLALELRQPE